MKVHPHLFFSHNWHLWLAKLFYCSSPNPAKPNMTHLLISSRLAATHPTLRSSDAVNVLFKPLQRKQLLMPSKLSSDNGTLLCKDCDKTARNSFSGSNIPTSSPKGAYIHFAWWNLGAHAPLSPEWHRVRAVRLINILLIVRPNTGTERNEQMELMWKAVPMANAQKQSESQWETPAPNFVLASGKSSLTDWHMRLATLLRYRQTLRAHVMLAGLGWTSSRARNLTPQWREREIGSLKDTSVYRADNKRKLRFQNSIRWASSTRLCGSLPKSHNNELCIQVDPLATHHRGSVSFWQDISQDIVEWVKDMQIRWPLEGYNTASTTRLKLLAFEDNRALNFEECFGNFLVNWWIWAMKKWVKLGVESLPNLNPKYRR